MKNPREYGLKPRSANHSPLMASRVNAKDGETVCACPYGCVIDEEADEHGRCHHLVGCTNDGKTYEPMSMSADGRWGMNIPRIIVNGKEKPQLPRIRPDDHLEWITTSALVYRKNVPAPALVPAGVDDGPDEDSGEENDN